MPECKPCATNKLKLLLSLEEAKNVFICSEPCCYFKTVYSVDWFVISCHSQNETEEIKANSVYITDVFEYVYARGSMRRWQKLPTWPHFKGDPAQHSKWLYLGGLEVILPQVSITTSSIAKVSFLKFMYALVDQRPNLLWYMLCRMKTGMENPNETWYELKGNQFENSKRNYWLRYYKPSGSANVKWLVKT